MAKGRLWLGITSTVLLVILAAMQVLSYLSVVINPARAWFMTLFGLLFIPVCLLNLAALAWTLLRRRFLQSLIPLLALLPSLFLLGRFFPSGPEEKILEGDRPIKMISYNVARFLVRDGFSRRSEVADSIWRFLRSQDADIICLQEFYIQDARSIRTYLAARMPEYDAQYYLYPTPTGAYGNVILSRFKAKGKGVLDFEQSSNLVLYADYRADGRDFRIYNCHFESYNISLSRLVHVFDRGQEGLLHETEDKMRRSISRRPRQVDAVIGHIEECTMPTFVCGDFNDGPMSYTYHRLSRGRTDAFRVSRRAGGTYPAFLFSLRIDYILSPPPFVPLDYEVPRIGVSDHEPVVSTLVLRKNESAN